MANNTYELHILVGLPGSGKTYFANETKRSNENPRGIHKETTIIDFDSIMNECGMNHDEIIDNIPRYFGEIVIADGLFLTQKDVEAVIDYIIESQKYKKRQRVMSGIVIHQWRTDVDACIWNDNGRRKKDSLTTILNSNVENISHRAISEKYHVGTGKFMYDVVRKPNYMVMCDKYGIIPEYDRYDSKHNNPYFKSETWSLGGVMHGWDGSSTPLDADEPVEFEEFDNLMERIKPDITFLQYKKIYRACVEQNSQRIDDYYADGTEGYWVCYINKLYDILSELKLIE